MATEDFLLSYDGPALREGRMPVRELAPALLALGELFQRANEITQPEGPPVNLEVRAFGNGSFAAELSAVTVEAIRILTSDPAVALSVLTGSITDAGRGVFAALRVIRGRIVRRTPQPDGTTTIEDVNGNVFNAPNGTINIVSDSLARAAAAEAMMPLRDPGVDVMRIERREQEPLVVTEEVVEALDSWEEEEPEEAELINDQSFEAVVTPLTPTLDPRYMARFAIGDQVIRAKITDENYWNKIHRHEEGFLEGDIMRVRLRMRQRAAGPVEWTVEEVIRHTHPAGRQGLLPFPQAPEEG